MYAQAELKTHEHSEILAEHQVQMSRTNYSKYKVGLKITMPPSGTRWLLVTLH